jgi:phage head maturation protease
MTRALMSRAEKMPYGDVAYADPGLQEDGKERYPLDTEDHVRAAWTYIHQRENADKYTPEQLKRVVGRIRRAMKRIGATVDNEGRTARSRLTTEARLRSLLLSRSGPETFHRSYALDDIQISRSGDGRTVEAYAAIFDSPYEVRDQHGHYMESIDRSAFNRTLNGAGRNALCVYNHGMTLHGTPDGMASLTLGNPLEIRPDGRGLLTVTRYNKGPWADSVLESIKNGEIKAQSFRGQIYRSNPMGPIPRRRPGAPLPTVTRHELGLVDYGPTPTAVNADAHIVAVRSAADVLDAIQFLDADEREELLRMLNLEESTPDLEEDDDPDDEDLDDEDVEEEEDLDEEDGVEEQTATSDDSELGAEDPPAERSNARHSGRLQITREFLLRDWNRRGDRRGKAA